jgi:hypothetical protein
MNSFITPDPLLVDVFRNHHDGYPERLAAADREPGVLWQACGAASRSMPERLRVPESQWEARARENDKNNTWPVNYIDRFTMQNPTHECTAHSLLVNAECARNRMLAIIFPEGPKKDFRYEQSKKGSVWFSCLWPYIKANPRKWGGAGVRQVMEIVCQYGFLPEFTQPAEYGFKHQIAGTNGQGNSNQSRGEWLSVSQLPNGWEDTAAWFRPDEVIFPSTWQDAVSLVLNGYVVSVGRNGHAVPYVRWLPNEQLMEYVDSYNILRYDSLRTVKACAANGSFSIATMTAPNSWDRPAG